MHHMVSADMLQPPLLDHLVTPQDIDFVQHAEEKKSENFIRSNRRGNLVEREVTKVPKITVQGIFSTDRNILEKIDRNVKGKQLEEKIKQVKSITDPKKQLEAEKAIDKRFKIEDDIRQLKKEQERKLESIERLKFLKDPKTGIYYFDTIRKYVRKNTEVVANLRNQYIENLKILKAEGVKMNSLDFGEEFIDVQEQIQTTAATDRDEKAEVDQVIGHHELMELLGSEGNFTE